jgi:hypothetical protein
MFGFAWLTLRQAQEALKTGRLEEALRLLRQPAARNHKRGGELLVALARAFAERGERHLGLDKTEDAWNDLLQAEKLETAEKTPDRLRQSLVRLGLAELRAMLLAGEVGRAEQLSLHLRQRQVAASELGVLEEGLRAWLRSREYAERGELVLAGEAAERAGRLLGVNASFETFRDALVRNQRRLPALLLNLHDAAAAERWREVLGLCDEVLAIAPAHAEARALRSRAWRAIEPTTAVLSEDDDRAALDGLPPRFWLWIDGVGGYLVCLGTRLTFGQAMPDGRVDVPLIADVSRVHATIGRDGEGYVLESVRPIQVNNATVTRSPLQSGDRFTLGPSCQFLFRLPVAGSNTARVDLVSGHRLPAAVEGVLLMAETLVIGPTAQAHITAAELTQPIILFRHRDGLGVRYKGELRVNGQVSAGRTFLPPVATVTGDEISFAIEPTK